MSSGKGEELPDPRQRWAGGGAGERYQTRRWTSRRKRERDPAIVRRLLRAAGMRKGSVLDVPCGAGRLRPALESLRLSYTGVDVSGPMLAAARDAASPASNARFLRADVLSLPFPDASFDAVVCCRLLHHFDRREDMEATVRELVRASRRLVVASFWDAASLAGLRRHFRRRRSGRHPCPRSEIAAAFEAAGARVLRYRSTCRFITMQTHVLAEKEPSEPAPGR